jgi:hypothetical protein
MRSITAPGWSLSDERTFEIRLPEGRVFVRYRGRPADLKFAVMLQARTADGWQTVCLIDNAEGKGTHIHRYEGTRKCQPRRSITVPRERLFRRPATFFVRDPEISSKHGQRTTRSRSSHR